MRWGCPGTLPGGLLANMFVTEAPAVVTMLIGGTGSHVGEAAAGRSGDYRHFSEEVSAVARGFAAPALARHGPTAAAPGDRWAVAGTASTRAVHHMKSLVTAEFRDRPAAVAMGIPVWDIRNLPNLLRDKRQIFCV